MCLSIFIFIFVFILIYCYNFVDICVRHNIVHVVLLNAAPVKCGGMCPGPRRDDRAIAASCGVVGQLCISAQNGTSQQREIHASAISFRRKLNSKPPYNTTVIDRRRRNNTNDRARMLHEREPLHTLHRLGHRAYRQLSSPFAYNI